jgi:nitrite reductase/ring-hydroxylating ferredoxin subunit
MPVRINRNELPEIGSYKYFDFPEHKNELLIFCNEEGMYHIFSSFCPHFGGPLSIKDGGLYCWFHEYKYSLETGECTNRSLKAKCWKMAYIDHQAYVEVEV